MSTFGPSYDAELDGERIATQLERVKKYMLEHGQWKTLAEISSATGGPQASISAQLRHLRKKDYGSFLVDKRRRGNPRAGVYEYRVRRPTDIGDDEAFKDAIKSGRKASQLGLGFVFETEHIPQQKRQIETDGFDCNGVSFECKRDHTPATMVTAWWRGKKRLLCRDVYEQLLAWCRDNEKHNSTLRKHEGYPKSYWICEVDGQRYPTPLSHKALPKETP